MILILCGSAFAQTALEWQKVELEEKILHKIKSNLRNIIEPHQFFVEVDLTFNDPGMPNFDDLKKKGSKVSDVRFDDSKGDYIAFSKVGLEVPVVEDMYNENQQKLKEMYRYQESFALFKNNEDVKITVFLSDLLSDDQVEFVKNVVNNLKFPVGDIKPKIVYTSLKLEKKKELPKTDQQAKAKAEEKKKDDKLTLKDILEFISRFGNAIGLITATILFGLIAYYLLKKWEEIKKNLAKKPEEEKKPEEAVAVVEEVTVPEIPAYMLSSQENIARLRHFIETSNYESMVMVKNWINDPTLSNQMALRAVAQQFSDEELVNIFKSLNDQERDKWKDHLDHFLDDQQLAEANQYISEEVIRTMIDPGKIKEIEVIDLVLNLSLDLACKFVVEKPAQGKVLMNLLNPQTISKIINRLDEAQADKVILNSMTFDFNEVNDNYKSFSADLNEFILNQKRRPFNQKIVQMVSDFNPLKEGLLYTYLAKSGMYEEMLNVAKQFIPFDCVQLLPKEVLKEIMQTYPMNKKVQLLTVCDLDLKETLMNAFADQGSTARQMIDMEFNNLNADKVGLTRLQMQKDGVLKEFIAFVRSYVMANKQVQQDIEPVVKEWIESSYKQKPELKLVS
jgi:hypothetical protein